MLVAGPRAFGRHVHAGLARGCQRLWSLGWTVNGRGCHPDQFCRMHGR
jgi:hypothetical protein